MNLEDKIIIITGGSRGFGKSLAKAFASEGANVIIASHDKDELEKASQELRVDSCLTDVIKPEDVASLGDYVHEKYGRIDVWINNAGIQIAPSKVEDVNIAKLRYLYEVNFFGYFYGCQTAIQHMKKQGSGIIININSTAGLDGKPELTAYSSSKFAIKGLTEAIRKETIDTGVQIHAIYPGGMQTDIYKEKYPDDIKQYMLVDDVTEKVINNLKSDSPQEDLIIKRSVAK